ncbi:class A beta-lactamase-related serine hydrolase [Bifidobacterium pseudolongum]|uniref:class A beta-lactamase-related serine hydrolase n=1 Tax=Bifidobacterium pseudolongum TaxID=1694 RepID=UPI001D0B9987|nr:class A beta-lactamase-related serine hydrolase [Bifidobacterium pseudolongum]UDL23799.1 class A beta-lactamase-related serine hydrolase [Bifidobacterium pseudolongum]
MTDAQLDNAIVRHTQSASRWKVVCFSALLVAALSAASMGVAVRQTTASAAAPAASATATMQSQAQPTVSPSPAPTITPTPTLAQVVPAAFANLNQLDGSSTLASAGVKLNEMQRSQLMERIEDFRAQGYQASFVVVDMRTGAAIASYGGTPMYTASAIKAPYIVSLAQTGAVDVNAVATSATADAAGINQLITQTLQVSDNDMYEALYKRFGAAPTMQWLDGTGAGTGLNGYYGDVTAIDMARMWVNSYDYLFGASADAADAQGRTWLAQQMRSSLNSSIAAVHGEGEIVASKAGWIYGEGNLYAYNDAGIVIPVGATRLAEQPQGYVLAMLTNACARDDLLTALAQTVDSAMRAA